MKAFGIGAPASRANVVFCNGVHVVWTPFACDVSEAWRYARYSDQRANAGARLFQCDSEAQALELARVLN